MSRSTRAAGRRSAPRASRSRHRSQRARTTSKAIGLTLLSALIPGSGLLMGGRKKLGAFVLTISVVSFPLLLDRDCGLDTAIGTSFRAVLANPAPMALWGLIVAALLLAGSALVFVGLMVAIPVLGHATWHLYRKLIA